MTRRKKKKATMAELALGGGLLALFLPVILFAFVWGLIALAVGLVFTFAAPSGPSLWPVALVYGGLLAAMLFTAYRFSKRFALLMRRLIGLIRERRRIHTSTHALIDDSDGPAQFVEDDAQIRRLSR